MIYNFFFRIRRNKIQIMLGERLRVYIFCQLKLLFVTETLLAYIIADTKINLIQPGDK